MHDCVRRFWGMFRSKKIYFRYGFSLFQPACTFPQLLCLPSQNNQVQRNISWLIHHSYILICISIMNQYTPMDSVKKYPELSRKVTDREYERVVDYAMEIGVENGYIQILFLLIHYR